MEKNKPNQFSVILLGIVFDPESRKVLVGKRQNDPYIKELSSVFPGGRASHEEKLEETLKRKVKEETGYEIESLGSVFSRIMSPERKDFLLIYYLCEVSGGEMKTGEPLKQAEWVDPEDLEKEFNTSFDPALKEYINNLKSSKSE